MSLNNWNIQAQKAKKYVIYFSISDTTATRQMKRQMNGVGIQNENDNDVDNNNNNNTHSGNETPQKSVIE